MLLRTSAAPKSAIAWPVIECLVEDWRGIMYSVTSCNFHNLTQVPDYELAGMGLAIIGNVCKLMREAEQQRMVFKPTLFFVPGPHAESIRLPWPGMPDARPLDLSPEALPFETAMFLNEEGDGKKRIDRLTLMARIAEVWVPHLKSLMVTRS